MIAVIDYGMGNLRSVSKAVEKVGAKVTVTNKNEDIEKADSLILPGVGAFYMGMENIKKFNLLSPIKNSIKREKPFLGICLGLQLLFTESQEHGENKGLDLIKGKVKRFKGNMKIPHMGWNQVLQVTGHPVLTFSRCYGARKYQVSSRIPIIFKNITQNSYFYFVHSYYVEPEDENITIATTEYGKEFTSVIQKDNIYGVQFHPEKSSDLGMKVLENFVEISENT